MNLPVEVVRVILLPAPRKLLLDASLVCRTWQALAFPLLYHTIWLSKEDKGIKFTNKIVDARTITEKLRNTLIIKLSDCVRHLYAAYWIESRLHEILAKFGSAIINLPRLEYLEWYIGSAPLVTSEWHSTLARITKGTPNLTSLKLIVSDKVFSSVCWIRPQVNEGR